MNIRDLRKELNEYSIADKKLIKLSDNSITHLFNVADLEGQNISSYIKEALYNYSDVKFKLNQIDKLQDIATKEVIKLIAEEEIKNYIKIFKKKKVEITKDELMELLIAKINYEME